MTKFFLRWIGSHCKMRMTPYCIYAFLNWTFRAFAWKWIRVLLMPEWWYTHDGEIYMTCCVTYSAVVLEKIALPAFLMREIPVKDYLALLHNPRAW